jgi:hypothetical protein
MLPLAVHGIGLLAPGLPGWRDSLPILQGTSAYRFQELPAGRCTLLPANERRRTTRVIDLALRVGQETITQVGIDPREINAVFASSEGDGEIIDKLCTALALPQRPISPTLFHNSVHNAPAGYWSIATAGRLPSVSISAYDDTFSAGLLTAATLVLAEQATVLLVAYDAPLPFPLSEKRRLAEPFATALLLSCQPIAPLWGRLQLRLATTEEEDRLDQVELERLRLGNPAARSLPLLRALAVGIATTVVLPYSVNHKLTIDIAP